MCKYPAIYRLLAAATLLMMAACGKDTDPQPAETPPRFVRTLVVAPTTDSVWREFPGVVDAAQKADLSFRVSGRLVSLSAQEGDTAKRGDILARLDDKDYEIQLDSRKAEYASAHADYLRGRELVKTGVISQSDFNKLQAADATAKAALDAARQNLAYTRLEAPFDGRIAVRHVDNFEELGAKQAVYTLQDTSTLLIKVDIPESLMIRVREGARPEVWAEFNQLPDQRFPLTFSEVATRADEKSNTFVVSFMMENADAYNILPGMSVTVRGKRPSDEADAIDAFHVPAHAVLADDDGRYLYVVESVSEDRGKVRRRTVETGRLSTQGLEVTAGLETGDRVVTAGMSKMRPGLEVRLSAEQAK